MKKPDIKKLGITESYYHLDDDGNFHYLFLSPGHKKEDFDISYKGDLLTVKTEETRVSVRVSYYGYRFDFSKAESEYKDGMLIVSVPPKTNVFGKGKIAIN